MFVVEFSVLLGLSALLAFGTLAHAVMTSLPRVAALRQAAHDCPETLEVRFILREMVVRYDDGKVVPLRPRTAFSPAPQRAAA